jgi:exodeoxyribonuclease (lambda-induced)
MRVACPSQDSSEWFTARIGKVTASCIADAIKFVWKGSKARNDKRLESSAVRDAYISELAWGMITRVPIEHYVSKAMDLGKEYEGDARRAYSLATEQMVDQTGFILHPTMDIMGASPDGLVPEFKRGVELKVPQFRTHKALLETEQIPELWTLQCYCGMLCCEYDEWDFCSFLPPDDRFGYEAVSLPDEFRLFRKRFHRDEAAEELFRRMEDGAQQTIEDAIKKVQFLQKMYPRKGAPKSKFVAELEMSNDMADTLAAFDEYVMNGPEAA